MKTGSSLARAALFLSAIGLVVGLVTCGGGSDEPTTAGAPTEAGLDSTPPAQETGPRTAAPSNPSLAQVSGGGLGRSSNFQLWVSFGAPQPQGRGKSARYGLGLGPPQR